VLGILPLPPSHALLSPVFSSFDHMIADPEV